MASLARRQRSSVAVPEMWFLRVPSLAAGSLECRRALLLRGLYLLCRLRLAAAAGVEPPGPQTSPANSRPLTKHTGTPDSYSTSGRLDTTER